MTCKYFGLTFGELLSLRKSKSKPFQVIKIPVLYAEILKIAITDIHDF